MRNIIFFLLFCFPLTIYAQEGHLYESLNYKNSVDNGMRSRDGHPGPEYFQNHADYNISVRLDTSDKKIFGSEEITYYNNSTDTLQFVVLRLYPNRYMKGAVRNMGINPANIHEGVELDTIFINDTSFVVPGVDRRTFYYGTNLLVILEDPIFSGDKIKLRCNWNYRIPTEPEDRRQGYFTDNIWFIGYFYPQIAVYDDLEKFYNIKGWDFRLFHLGAQEFYNDFNNYSVCIEVPDGFYVWATGTQTNPEEVYSDEFLKKIQEARSKDTLVHLLNADNLEKDNLTGSTWKFEARKVPDFAFGTAPNCIWDASNIKINDRRVSIDAVYHPESDNFPMVIHEAKKTLEYTSNDNPGIPYPYDHLTVFNGSHGGGMEFPMIANDADFPDSISTSYVTFHEIFHNYVPFMMGLNEKRYPFMDEGLTDFFSSEYVQDQYGTNFFFAPGSQNRVDDYNYFSSMEDAPLIGTYAQLDETNTVFYYYVKPSMAYMLFKEMVGEKNFLKSFHEFVHRWKGKHPTPYDFFYTINDVLNENYNWFWKAWFFSYGYPDLGLELTNKKSVLVQRVGEGSLPLPVKLNIVYSDGTEKTIYRPMNVWRDGAEVVEIKLDDFNKISEISLDTETIPDISHINNSIKMN